jgi:hypothetical protein
MGLGAAGGAGLGDAAWSKGKEAQRRAWLRMRRVGSGTGRVLWIQYEWDWGREGSFLWVISRICKTVRDAGRSPTASPGLWAFPGNRFEEGWLRVMVSHPFAIDYETRVLRLHFVSLRRMGHGALVAG